MNRNWALGKSILFLALLSLIFLICGFFKEVDVGQKVLYYLLTISLFFKLLKVGFEWYHYAGLPQNKKNNLKPIRPVKKYTVDMLTTFCPWEPYDMLENTLKAMVAVKYPHTTYLCDEGNDPIAKKLCQEMGVVYVTRETHENAKAGNINNALKQATGEICVILDPDHAPFPEFLDHILHHFDNPEIGFVQVVQAYGNQSKSLVAQGAAEQTYNFYGPYMRAMGAYGTAQAIGANCTFRREALDSIGGHAPGLTEDMHTSMLLHAKGWKSVYVPRILSRGLVPSSLSAFYKQQLKWSRGTFDLWFNLFPKLFKMFDWRQKLHYGLIPIYYLFGLIGIIDIIVPIYSLISGEFPWLMNPLVFFTYFTPFIFISLLYRLYAQAWLNHPNEKGLHIMGGILRVGSWWVFTLGFIYTLLKIEVPYIPTQKDHSSKGEFLLGLPNLLVAIASIVAVYYGMYLDWQPYSLLMALFASINAAIFFLTFAMGQTVWVDYTKSIWVKLKNKNNIRSEAITYLKLSRMSFYAVLLLLLFANSFFIMNALNFENQDYLNPTLKTTLEKEMGGFYSGIYDPNFDKTSDIALINSLESDAGHQWSIISSYLAWGDNPLPVDKWKKIIQHGAIPMVTWEPWSNLFDEFEEVEDLKNNRKIFKYIVDGYFDTYIDQMAETLRDLNSPFFLRFAHEMENPLYSWSKSGDNCPEEFIQAWKYIHFRFENSGAQNVVWVWSPWSTEGFESYFPYGIDSSYTQYVDWISLTALNYGYASENNKEKTFEEIYLPFKKEIEKIGFDLPVMLAEFGSTSYGTDGKLWVQKSLEIISKDYPEIKSIVLFYSDRDQNWGTDWRPIETTSLIDWTFDTKGMGTWYNRFDLSKTRNYWVDPETGHKHKVIPKMLTNKNGNHQLIVDGQPFYIKGICYNTGQGWEEGFTPLSRKQLDNDFQLITDMGANTIRRYEPGIYDRNILKAAKDHNLKVMFGFWFDPKVDYLKDKNAIKAYERKVLSEVTKHKKDKSIIAWNIGNETWGLLKKHFSQPYLSMVRRSYLQFLDDLATKIKEIDPERPVFSSEEHDNERLIGAINQFKVFAPNVDVIGVNSYYKENISQVNSIFKKVYPDQPYAITEFGPNGYWNKALGDYRNDSIILELSSLSKAKWYKKQWEKYILKFSNRNLGGFAFSWRDRYEGTATWFGITDYKGRLKPAYYYLQDTWLQDGDPHLDFPEISILGRWQNAYPGEKIWFSAEVLNGYKGLLEYEWKFQDERNWKTIKPNLTFIKNNEYIEFEVPSNIDIFRVYLYATDSLGNVITASRPIFVNN